jgi:hypothetical protein
MQHLRDLTHWQALEVGEYIDFASERPRTIKMHVNTSEKVPLMIDIGEEAGFRLLALVEGLETLTFVVPGAFKIAHMSETAHVQLLTADGTTVHRVNVDAVAYTRLHERKPVNEEFEFMRYQMEANARKNMEMMAAQFERRLQDAVRPASAPSDDTGAPKPPVGQPTPPAEPVADAGAGSGGV